MLKSLKKHCESLNIELNQEFLVHFFQLNASLQDYYPELAQKHNQIADDILEVVARIGGGN